MSPFSEDSATLHFASVLAQTTAELDAYPQMLDAASVASLSPFPRLKALASRNALECLSHIAGEPPLFSTVHMGSLTLIDVGQ